MPYDVAKNRIKIKTCPSPKWITSIDNQWRLEETVWRSLYPYNTQKTGFGSGDDDDNDKQQAVSVYWVLSFMLSTYFHSNLIITISDSVCLCCLNRKTIEWVAYKQWKFSSHSSEGWKSGIRGPVWLSFGERPLSAGGPLVTSLTAERRRTLSHDSRKHTNPIHGDSILMTSCNPGYLPIPSCWGVRVGVTFQHITIRGTQTFSPAR